MLEGKLEYISTHAPYEGSDVIGFKGCRVLGQFQPTLPVRGATGGAQLPAALLDISIHAPREGSDTYLMAWASSASYFNPRSP